MTDTETDTDTARVVGDPCELAHPSALDNDVACAAERLAAAAERQGGHFSRERMLQPPGTRYIVDLPLHALSPEPNPDSPPARRPRTPTGRPPLQGLRVVPVESCDQLWPAVAALGVRRPMATPLPLRGGRLGAARPEVAQNRLVELPGAVSLSGVSMSSLRAVVPEAPLPKPVALLLPRPADGLAMVLLPRPPWGVAQADSESRSVCAARRLLSGSSLPPDRRLRWRSDM